MIDFRSDTFTKPTPGMMDAMMKAQVGDDVFGEDPSVNLLEAKMADLFGMEAALYCPSGTMSNQVAIKVHTLPGDEVICSHLAHVYIYEGGGIAFNAGAQTRPINSNRGMIKAAQVEAAINPDDVHKARTSLVCLENTSNRGGGCCYDWNDIVQISEVCEQSNLQLHLDGARLFNALVATKQEAKDYGGVFDSISVCFNKGMGCPMGSVLMGSRGFIREARRVRKKLGGGLRQAGYMAATCLYALDHHIGRLQEDHDHAKMLATALIENQYVGHMFPVDTNIIIFDVQNGMTAQRFSDILRKDDILVMPVAANQVRIVTHLDVNREMVQQACDAIVQMQNQL